MTFSTRCGWAGVFGVLLATVPVRAAEPPNPRDFLFRAGAFLGVGHNSNVYRNASQLDDQLGVGGLSFNGDWLPTTRWILKGAYRGEAEVFRQLSDERNLAQSAVLQLGYRSSDTTFLTLDGGVEHAFFPRRPTYTFWGAFGRVALRWELGDASTLRLGYRFRGDQFPDYDLDNWSHQMALSWEQALGDELEARIPLGVELLRYRERFVLDSTGAPTADHATGQRWTVEPTLIFLPTFSLRVETSAKGEYNDSEDTYLFTGPFGVADPTVDTTLIRHFDSYYAIGGAIRARWDVTDRVVASVGVRGGVRRFLERPAYDATGAPTAELEVDYDVWPSVNVEWWLDKALSLAGHYAYGRQWSNDALWDYDQHRVLIKLSAWWQS